MPLDRLLVTGGAGFIGSALVRAVIERTGASVANVDCLTYAGNLESLGDAQRSPRYRFDEVDIREREPLSRVFREFRPDAVVHLAAESHVDRSIEGPDGFVTTNVLGTFTLLEVCRQYVAELEPEARERFRVLHVSTDEVYGDLEPDAPAFTEDDRYAPSSPYSASKAASDHLARAWHRTYDLPVLITNCSNNYGPYQYPEKLIPLMILNALDGLELPVYGRGDNVRDWLYVEDHADALLAALERGRVGRTYNIGGRSERTNIDVVERICARLDELAPRADGRAYTDQIRFVTDRLGHDRRYAIDDARIASELGWAPKQSFDTGLERTVEWYLENRAWADRVRARAATREPGPDTNRAAAAE